MTIEVKELIMRFNIAEPSTNNDGVLPNVADDDIVDRCVEQVLKVLEQAGER